MTAEAQGTAAALVAGDALVLGRALHAPWNEGTRVINRNFIRAARSRRVVRVLSITNNRFREALAAEREDAPDINHVYTSTGYGIVGIYAGLPMVLRDLNAELTRRPVQVAHLFGVPLSLAPWLSARRTRVVAHVMGHSVRARDRALVWASTRLFDRWVDAYAITSEALLPALLRYGAGRNKIELVPPAIDTALYQPGDRLAARRHLGLDPSECLILYLGRLSPRRFPAPVVAEALTLAAQRTARRVHFVALAPNRTFDGSENTASRMRDYTRTAERYFCQLPGVRSDIRQTDLLDSDKISWFRAADAVLLPFRAPEAVEPALSLLEAMACGAVTVATPAANRSGLIRHGTTGLLYDGPEQLAATLADVLDQRIGPAIGEHARLTVLERHSLATVAAAAQQLWLHLEERSRRKRDWRS